MALTFHISYEPNWQSAPLAFWVHVPGAGSDTDYTPVAPTPVLHKGYVFLHVEAGNVDLQFSSKAQLDHFIEVLASKPLPTSGQLSRKRNVAAGPNGHWLSRLPVKLKAPRARARLVEDLRAIRQHLLPLGDAWHRHGHLP
jgi:hypothetical protein